MLLLELLLTTVLLLARALEDGFLPVFVVVPEGEVACVCASPTPLPEAGAPRKSAAVQCTGREGECSVARVADAEGLSAKSTRTLRRGTGSR